ncbi:hypothetical protein [Jiella sonneratiae]|uniref:Uncharacterized protein n=1 Tax=Jiella sonneratiae TaxID=2816856 RepID=A0ABS3J8F8_9HYPH|nr:hypothetical protein [Jiella sonneratiae]MBO0905955.1 hypothetical protein [Jiella sonneratiae]
MRSLRKILLSALLPLVGTLAPALAFADTYAVVINATKEPILLNGANVPALDSAWTPLNANITFADGTSGNIMDMHAKCSGNSGWLLMSNAQLPTPYCIPLGFAEIGCIFATVRRDPATGLRKIDMQKTRGTACSDNWYQKGGSKILGDVADKLLTYQGNVGQVLGAIVP